MISHSWIVRLLLVSAIVPACVVEDDDPEDGIDDVFVADGKADVAGVAEGSVEAIGILAAANRATFTELDVAAKLSSRTAHEIVKRRSGGDGVLGTADDRSLETLAQLDAVPYVGPVAVQQLLAYARTRGWVPAGFPSSMLYQDHIVKGTCTTGWVCSGPNGGLTLEARMTGYLGLQVNIAPGGTGLLYAAGESVSYDGWAGASGAVIERLLITGLGVEVPLDGSERRSYYSTTAAELQAIGRLGSHALTLTLYIGPAQDLINRHTCSNGIVTTEFSSTCNLELPF
jgi:hypothetical protein